MKRISVIIAFVFIAMATQAQVSKSVQDSTIKYYIELRDFVANVGQHDTAGMHALMAKHLYWRTKGLAQCRTQGEKDAFLDSSVVAYRKYVTGQ